MFRDLLVEEESEKEERNCGGVSARGDLIRVTGDGALLVEARVFVVILEVSTA